MLRNRGAPWLKLVSLAGMATALAPLTIDRRCFGAVVLGAPCIASGKQGDGARFGLPSDSEADAILGSRADTYGDASRANSLYNKQVTTDAMLKKKLASFETSAQTLTTKLTVAVDKNQFPKITDALNAEAYTLKTLLSDITKTKQNGKVCLVDISQRGITMPAGFDPSECPLQLKQTAILQSINDLQQSAITRDSKGAVTSFANLSNDIDAFLKAATI